MAELLAASDYPQGIDWPTIVGLIVVAAFVVLMTAGAAAWGVFDRWLYSGDHRHRKPEVNEPRDIAVWESLDDQSGWELAEAQRGGER